MASTLRKIYPQEPKIETKEMPDFSDRKVLILNPPKFGIDLKKSYVKNIKWYTSLIKM